jgi:hypothetical protein
MCFAKLDDWLGQEFFFLFSAHYKRLHVRRVLSLDSSAVDNAIITLLLRGGGTDYNFSPSGAVHVSRCAWDLATFAAELHYKEIILTTSMHSSAAGDQA